MLKDLTENQQANYALFTMAKVQNRMIALDGQPFEVIGIRPGAESIEIVLYCFFCGFTITRLDHIETETELDIL